MNTTVERTSWNEFATRLRPFIARRVATAADAEDVLQDVLLRMYRGVRALEDEDRFVPWMYRIARNSIADHLRARARYPLATAESCDDIEASRDNDDDAVARDVAQYLAFFVALLPSPYREAVTLTELEGRTQQEAAEMLGISLSGMKSRVQRGRAKLRQMLEACCEIALDARGRVISCEPRPLAEVPDNCCS